MELFGNKKYKIIILGILFLFPVFSFASGINYGDVLYQGTDSFIMQYGNRESPDYYNCTVSTLTCVGTGKISPLLPDNQTPVSVPNFTFSSSSVFKNNIHTRNFSLRDNNTGKVYTRSYKFSFWDTLGDEGTTFAFSPDYKKLVYQDDSTGYPVLYSVNLTTLKGNTFKGTKVFTKSFSVSGFTLTSANNLYYIGNSAGPYQWNLYKYDFATKKTLLVAKNASYAFKIRNFENGITFFVIQGTSSFPEFYNETTKQIENFSGFMRDTSEATVNSKDISFGGGMHGVLVTPLIFDKKTPHQLVIWLHGGPYRQTSLGYHPYASYAVYDSILNNMVENNVVVLKLDYGGSYGYGANFEKLIINNVGKGDVADVTNALKTIKKSMVISDTYLMGNSYGGYLALRSIVGYPKQFSGAISINGVTDWSSMLTDMQDSIFNVDFHGIPGKSNAKLYTQASILSRVTNLTDQKIVLIQSQSDTTIPPSQGDLLYKALQDKGKNVVMYPYADEDHTIVKTSDLESICRNVFDALSISATDNCNFQ